VKLVVGLGNPGRRYARTRHNVGWRIAERFADDCGLRIDTDAFGGRFGRGTLACVSGAQEVGVLLPQGYMNRSGESVAEALDELPIDDPSRDLLIVFDDVDLPFGRLRLRPRGSAGGHRGLFDVIMCLDREDVPRLRFGVGRGGAGGRDTAEWVLESFAPDEERQLEQLVPRAAQAIASALCDGIEAAMNVWNQDPAPPPAAD
jgi:PTH1 family peptidyl-tRNA hydrolase